MARKPEPWFRKDRKAWFVTICGVRHNLGKHKKRAYQRFYELMRKPPTEASLPHEAFVAVADLFLDWVKHHRAADTFEWYRYRLERFCNCYPDLLISDLKPFHVQQWVDAYPTLSQTSKRNYIRSVKRCVKWAKQQGHISDNPIAELECPSAESKEIVVSSEQFREFCSFVRNSHFLELCEVSYETGCRPQEILRVEARHVDQTHARWVFPISEAKGKKKPRIVYLPPVAERITKKLAMRFPSGRLFRNSRGNPWTTDAVNCAFDHVQIRMGKAGLKQNGKSLDSIINADLSNSKSIRRLPERKREKLRNRYAKRFATRYSLYAFRHAFATRMLQSGRDALTVAILMGHNDPSTLARVYQHLAHNPEHLLQQATLTG